MTEHSRTEHSRTERSRTERSRVTRARRPPAGAPDSQVGERVSPVHAPRESSAPSRQPHGSDEPTRRNGESASHDAASSSTAASPELLHGIVEMAPDAIIVISGTGHIVLVNRQAEALFRYSRAELLGAPLEQLIPERLRTAHIGHRAHYNAHPRTRPMGIGLELVGRRKDSSEFPVEISLAHLMTDSGPLVISSIRDVTARKRLQAALQDAEQQARAAAEEQLHTLQTVLEELPSGVCLVRGGDARLVLANRAVREVWGAEWAIGQPMRDFIAENGIQVLHPNGKPMPLDRLVSVRAAGDGEIIRQHQQMVRHPDGSLLPVVVSAVPLDPALMASLLPPSADGATNDGARESMALVVYQDVSALIEAERVKDEFVALAAHELRNPMAALKGFATMLQQEARQEATHSAPPVHRASAPGYEAAVEDLREDARSDAVTEIQRATDRLVALTDDLLDVTRLQAGRLELHPEPHDLAALARRVARRLAITTSAHTVVVEAEPEYLVANLDVRRMEQVVTNLLNNAIKYSPAGGEIHVTLREHPAGVAELSVRDTGIGIPEAEQGRVFARFARAANARSHGIHGTGLGLYLCRELVERHGGRIWFESVEGHGSTFCFDVPLLGDEDAP